MERRHFLLIFVLLMVMANPSYAEIIILTNSEEIHHLQHQVELFAEVSGDQELEKIARNKQYHNLVPFKDWTEPLKNQTYYYGKIDINNQTAQNESFTEWILKFPLILTDIEVVVFDEAEHSFMKTGFFVPTYNRTFVPTVKANVIKINLPSNKTTSVYFKLINQRIKSAPSFDIQLIHSDTFYSSLKSKKQGNSLFIGFVLMMLIYNLFLFVYARDPAYVYYSIYLFAIATFSAYNTGDLSDFMNLFYQANAPQYISITKIICYIALIAYSAFLRSFLDLSQLLPKWNTIFKYLAIAAVPLIVLDIFLMISFNFNYDTADILTIGYILSFLATSIVFAFPLYKTRDKKGYFIIVGMALMGLGIFLTILDRFRTVDFSTLYFKIGTILEIIIFSLGLAFRRREVEDAKRITEFELEKSQILQEQEHKEAERLKELDNLKSTLYTNITHEFRTPLTVIMGMSEKIDDPLAKELIQRNSKNLLQLINQLLAFSKLESGNLNVKLKKGDLIAFLRYLTESFYSLANEKKIRLTFYSEVEALEIKYDEEKIQSIVYNLLSNALKFTEGDGKVILHVKTIQKDTHPILQIKVKDNGLGIHEKDLPYIFDRFFQSQDPKNKNLAGTGIGLAFTKELVQLLEGEISVTSQPGKGTEFLVSIPLKEIHNYLKTTPISTNSSFVEGSFPTESLVTKTDHSSKLPILLIIEDNPDVVIYIETCLKESYQIFKAKDGKVGIEKAIELIPDIIISDVMMPEKDGLEVCKALKTDERTNHIPIILLTAKATQESKLEGLKKGADAYLTKPFDKTELIIRLQKLVELRQKMQLKYAQKGSHTGSKPVTFKQDPFYERIVQIVESRFDELDFSIAQICKEVHMSHTQVYRKLKAITGKTPVQIIRQIRLEKANELLLHTNKNISEIAFDVGFKDPNYFSRAFHQEFGKAPSNIRNSSYKDPSS